MEAHWRLGQGSDRGNSSGREQSGLLHVAETGNSVGSGRAAAMADWKVQGAMVQTEMTMAVAREKSLCALGVAVTPVAKAGSNCADGSSSHGGDGSWKAQGTAATEAVTGRLRASLGGERM